MSLTSKLISVMLGLLSLSLVLLFLLNQYNQDELVDEIGSSTVEVSKAIQLSVAELTSQGESASALHDYMKGARNKGIREVNIFNTEGEILESSDPRKVGQRHDMAKMEKGLNTARFPPGHPADGVGRPRPYDLLVPVIVGDTHYGYVHINLFLDNIHSIQHKNFVQRLTAFLLVFLLGIVLTVYCAKRYTKPIRQIVESVKRVSTGDLSQTIITSSTDEIGELSHNFNHMVQKLRERELMERQLAEADHFARLGQLAAGIAHEIRNPLNFISLAADHLQSNVYKNAPVTAAEAREVLDSIKGEVRRLNYMVLNFMSYGRPLNPRKRSVACRELFEWSHSFLAERLADQGVSVCNRIDDNLPHLMVDPELLRICLDNVLMNALEAMSTGGNITASACLGPDGSTVQISVADQGCGIPPEILSSITKPYVTTKDAGVGLGLAITERILKAHGGELLVESALGHGTTFTLVVPVEQGEQEL